MHYFPVYISIIFLAFNFKLKMKIKHVISNEQF